MFRYLIAIAAGLAIGLAAAAYTVRAGAFGSDVGIGPWRTGRDVGTVDASARTRAVVALSGLLALPAREARYYTAATDGAGKPLDARCTYLVKGGGLPARWWSLTLYDRDGYLAGPGPYSIESAALLRAMAKENRATRAAPGYLPIDLISSPADGPSGWRVAVGPRGPGVALPTAGLDRFELTLRLYLPRDGGRGDPPPADLPAIVKLAC